jgi:alanyl-tRNA synthetase
MIRRATLHGERRLGIDGPLSGAVEQVATLMGEAYPELRQRQDTIHGTLQSEEAAFRRTLDAAQSAFAEVAAQSRGIIRGEDAFRLHDTYGFPIDLTVELAAEQGLSVDREGFNEQLAQQRLRSRRGAKQTAVQRTGLPATRFLGYDTLGAGATVLSVFRGNEQVAAADDGDEVEVYLDQTPMYAEGGGQVGDIGVIEGQLGTIEVHDVQRQGDAHAHYGVVVSGGLRVGEEVQVEVDHEARWATMRHHSATHLLHKALRTVLGEGATQAGSYVAPDTCTFDFNLERAVSAGELDAVFRIVNRAVRDDLPKTTDVMSLGDARRSGAMMLFGEKYADTVRVVSFGQFSTELCGGTHVERTGQIGAVVAVAEKSVGAGLRRVEFLAGERAESYQRELAAATAEATKALRVAPKELGERVAALVEERKKLQKEIEELRLKSVQSRGAEIEQTTRTGIIFRLEREEDPATLRRIADISLDSQAGSRAAIVLGDGGRLVIKTRADSGLRASDLFAAAVSAGGGRGGGDDRVAQGGGFSPDRFEDIQSAVARLAENGTS